VEHCFRWTLDIVVQMRWQVSSEGEVMSEEQVRALIARIDKAIYRVTHGMGLMRVPADPTDPDLVLADCKAALLAQAQPAVWVPQHECTPENLCTYCREGLEAQSVADAPSERERAIKLANFILDETGRDPDDNLSMLSRQLLRATERAQPPADLAKSCEEVMVKIGACYDDGSVDPGDLKSLMEFILRAGAKPPAEGLRERCFRFGMDNFGYGPTEKAERLLIFVQSELARVPQAAPTFGYFHPGAPGDAFTQPTGPRHAHTPENEKCNCCVCGWDCNWFDDDVDPCQKPHDDAECERQWKAHVAQEAPKEGK
jgi:hypothetical protein